jgi:hypothetical protein
MELVTSQKTVMTLDLHNFNIKMWNTTCEVGRVGPFDRPSSSMCVHEVPVPYYLNSSFNLSWPQIIMSQETWNIF